MWRECNLLWEKASVDDQGEGEGSKYGTFQVSEFIYWQMGADYRGWVIGLPGEWHYIRGKGGAKRAV